MNIADCNCKHCHYFKNNACDLGIYDKDRHNPDTHYCINRFDREIPKEIKGGKCNVAT